MPENDFRLEVLGTSFSITTDEDPVYLETVLAEYRRYVIDTGSISGTQDPLRTAVLAGFLICEELHRLREARGKNEESQEAEKITKSLITRIDEMMEQALDIPRQKPL